jgi:hypothetical protein
MSASSSTVFGFSSLAFLVSAAGAAVLLATGAAAAEETEKKLSMHYPLRASQ